MQKKIGVCEIECLLGGTFLRKGLTVIIFQLRNLLRCSVEIIPS